jgi:hypothetical protein
MHPSVVNGRGELLGRDAGECVEALPRRRKLLQPLRREVLVGLVDHPQSAGLVQAEGQIAFHPALVLAPPDGVQGLLEIASEVECQAVDAGVDAVGDLREEDRRLCSIRPMEQSHADDRSPVEVEGLVLCREHGNHWVRDEVARRTGGLCPEAWQAKQGRRSETIELVMRGRRLKVPVTRPRQKHNKTLTSEQKHRKKQAEKAKEAARKRVAAMFPDLYDTILADERAQRGLEPWTVEQAVRGGDANVDLGFAELFAELEDRGVDPT